MNYAIRTVAYAGLLVGLVVAKHALAEGYVRPTPVDTSAIPQLGETEHMSNPYRDNAEVIETGAHAYLLNCSGCHGLEAESGGMAPDLRQLTDSDEDDEWFINRVRGGYVQNGVEKMPAYAGTLSQEGMWAIRSYILSRP